MSLAADGAVVAGVLLLVAMLLVYRLVRRDRGIRITRLGVFVERERFDDETEPVDVDVADADTATWPRVDPPKD